MQNETDFSDQDRMKLQVKGFLLMYITTVGSSPWTRRYFCIRKLKIGIFLFFNLKTSMKYVTYYMSVESYDQDVFVCNMHLFCRLIHVHKLHTYQEYKIYENK